MVFPEVLALDQPSRKASANSNVSWCDDPIDRNPAGTYNPGNSNMPSTSGYTSDTERNKSSSGRSSASL